MNYPQYDGCRHSLGYVRERLPNTECQEIESPRGDESLGTTCREKCGKRGHLRACRAWKITTTASMDWMSVTNSYMTSLVFKIAGQELPDRHRPIGGMERIFQ
jgi:hypothetical protein